MKTLFKNLTIIAMLMIVSMSYGQDKQQFLYKRGLLKHLVIFLVQVRCN